MSRHICPTWLSAEGIVPKSKRWEDKLFYFLLIFSEMFVCGSLYNICYFFFFIPTTSEFQNPVGAYKCLQEEEGERDGICCNFREVVLPRSSNRELRTENKRIIFYEYLGDQLKCKSSFPFHIYVKRKAEAFRCFILQKLTHLLFVSTPENNYSLLRP